VDIMNKDTVKGAMDDVAGRVKRQTGEWTGDANKQAEGAGQQVKGKVEKAWGNVKDAAKDAANRSDADRDSGSTTTDRDPNDQSSHRSR
jgi:uncharacterized protein YjbJ (UPF0337 family)